MLVQQDQVNHTHMVGLMGSNSFTVDGDKMAALLLDNLYKNPVRAVVRESIMNAVEAMRASGKEALVTVHLPTMLEPWFSVTDTGTGLCNSDVLKYGTCLGASGKDGIADTEGGFGLGMKVGFAVADQYSVISNWHGVETTFSAYKDDFGKSKFVKLSERSTEALNGIEYRVPVEFKDFHAYEQHLPKVCKYMEPKPITNKEVQWEVVDYWKAKYSADGTLEWGMSKLSEAMYGGGRSYALMGDLAYELDSEQLKESNNDVYQQLIRKGVDIRVPIGSLPLPMSREGILYTPNSVEYLRSILKNVRDEVVKGYQDAISNCTNHWEAMLTYKDSAYLVRQLSEGGEALEVVYKGASVRNSVNIEAPFDSYYSIDPTYIYNRKTLSLSNHIVNKTKLLRHPDKVRFALKCTTSLLAPSKVKPIVFLVTTEDKRLPSRLLQHMKDTYTKKSTDYHDEDRPGVWLINVDDTTIVRVKAFLLRTFGFSSKSDGNVKVFSEEVDEYKVVRSPSAATRKVAKVLTWEGGEWSRSDTEVDLDTTTGIYVDTRRGELYGVECVNYYNGLTLVMKYLKMGGFIPEDTVLYGCPGSRKNTMKGHKNFASLDEVVIKALRKVKSISKWDNTKFNYIRAVYGLQHTLPVLKLDINVKEGYYNTIVNVKDLTETKKYKSWDSLRRLQSLLHYAFLAKHPVELCNTTNFEAYIKEKFYKSYPLLSVVEYGPDATRNKDAIEQYINLINGAK
jgi:hypothetical protein